MKSFISRTIIFVITITAILERTLAFSLRPRADDGCVPLQPVMKDFDIIQFNAGQLSTGPLNKNNVLLDLSCSEDPATCDRKSYFTYHWDDLCPYLQDIAQRHLGFNKTVWDKGAWSSLYSESWTDLTDDQKAANEFFCWDEFAWCSEDPDDCDPTAYGEYEWTDLCYYLQEEAKILGFDEETWGDGSWVEAQAYDWDELPQSPKNMTKAAEAFCFDKKSWDEAH